LLLAVGKRCEHFETESEATLLDSNNNPMHIINLFSMPILSIPLKWLINQSKRISQEISNVKQALDQLESRISVQILQGGE